MKNSRETNYILFDKKSIMFKEISQMYVFTIIFNNDGQQISFNSIEKIDEKIVYKHDCKMEKTHLVKFLQM